MEAASIPAGTPASQRLKQWIGTYGLISVLLILPVVFAIQDLSDQGNLSRLGENVVTGLSNGAIWALVAIGYTLVYGIVELINFAHGEIFMIGSFISASFIATIGLTIDSSAVPVFFGLLVALVVAMIGSGTLNVLIERVAYRPLRGAPKLAPLITAVGMSFILQNVGLLWKGGNQQGVPDLLDAQHTLFTVFGVTIENADILAVVVTIPLLIVMTTFINRSRLGKAMRATAQDPEAARLMGINVDTTISLTFLIAGALAGAAGLVVALYYGQTRFEFGFQFGLYAFTAAVLGGIGNLTGATVGGITIGLILAMSDRYLEARWTSVLVFSILILVLIFRPTGLLAEKQSERA